MDQTNEKTNQNETYNLKLHPMGENEFIGTIKMEESSNEIVESSELIETVVILDRSGSMADAVRRVTNEIIPLFLAKLSYESQKIIHFITFDTKAQLFTVTIDRMKSLTIRAQGGTNMAPAVVKLEEVLQNFEMNGSIRVLTISDGSVGDQKDSLKASTSFAEFCKVKKFSINSQAVRLFTSESQPDTTALCSLLQINNVTKSKLADISSKESNEIIATKIAELFKNDGLANNKTLKSESNAIMKFPWESSSAQIKLKPGNNVFWMNEKPSEGIKIDDIPVDIQLQPPMTLKKFQALMVDKLDFIVDHMKILKVVGTEEAEKVVGKMLDYFQKTEDNLTQKSSLVKYFNVKSLHKNKISNLLASIAKDEKINDLNSEQKADYLRGNEDQNNENSSLLEKILDSGLDIDSDEFKKAFLIIFFLILAMILHLIRSIFSD